MARATTRVSREDRLGFDEALVGGADEGIAIEIDPSEKANNPYLDAGDDDGDWDLPKDAPRGNGKAGDDDERARARIGEDREGDDRRGDRSDTRERDPARDRDGDGDGDGEDEDDARLAYDEDVERDRGGSRRSRRNRSRRQAIDTRDQTIEQLKEALAQQGAALQRLYGGQMQLTARDVQTRIEQHQAALDRADAEVAKAVTEADGATFAAIQKTRDTIAQDLWRLQNYQQGMAEQARRMAEGGEAGDDPRRQQQQQQPTREQVLAAQAQDREYQRLADVFADRYTWFDPENPRANRDSREVVRLAGEVAADGYQRHEKEYWHEMEKRMREAGFRPERGSGSRDERFRDDGDDDDRRPEPRRSNGNGNGDDRRRSGMPPTGRVSTGSRRGDQRSSFVLSDVQTDILQGEDLLRNNLTKEEQEKKDRIITKWREGARQLAGRR
jgi:hypothetical protein